ncbi:MAG: RecQ family ATP-dependent DNA helicase [Candidatus Aureabacteria bacterium]|nr:RecQ family ATP-dependent DNA helicase [Candidatus Auribacterota bacterium]
MENKDQLQQVLIDKGITPDSLSYLSKYFGFETFKAGQKSVIEKVIEKKNILAVMPTGGGKSLCYQLPAVIFKGITIVVSPLISLMKDQIDDLNELFIEATFINSSISAKEQENRINKAKKGTYKLLYIAPERFRSKKFVDLLKTIKVELLAIDEAHCISTWGHDFRPDYLRLRHFIKLMDNPPVIALTATATPEVQQDIIRQLDIGKTEVIVTGFDRENLIFSVIHTPTKKDKNAVLKDALKRNHGSAIVYVGTRKKAESTSEFLKSIGVKAMAYHAGMDDREREEVQNSFMNGKIPVLVATNAFGMGIDKDDIRYLIHYDIPGNIESYYQEAGRAGRDGKKSWCILLYSPSDIKLQEYFIDQSYPSKEQIFAVHNFLLNQEENLISKTREEIRKQLYVEMSEQGISSALRILKKAGTVDILSRSDNTASVKFRIKPEIITNERKSKIQKSITSAIIKNSQKDPENEMSFSFPMSKLIQSVDLTPDQIIRGLNNMDKQNIIEYIPPFRGKTILIKDRATPFEKLNIDWENLNEMRNREIKKLYQIVQYATSSACRRKMLLEYFGEKYAHDICPGCDICIGREILKEEPKIEETAYTDKEAAAAKNILKCVDEIEEPLIKIRVAQILTGSKAIVIKQNGYDRLRTYNSVQEPLESVMEIINRLVSDGFLRVSGAEHPVILLNKKGKDVLLGRKDLKITELHITKTADEQMDSIEESIVRQIEENPDNPEILYEAGNFYLGQAKKLIKNGESKKAIRYSEKGSLLLQRVVEEFPVSGAAKKASVVFRQGYENLSHKEIDCSPIVNNVPSCPRCGSKMVLREGEFGRFWGCSEYPYCRGTVKY